MLVSQVEEAEVAVAGVEEADVVVAELNKPMLLLFQVAEAVAVPGSIAPMPIMLCFPVSRRCCCCRDSCAQVVVAEIRNAQVVVAKIRKAPRWESRDLLPTLKEPAAVPKLAADVPAAPVAIAIPQAEVTVAVVARCPG